MRDTSARIAVLVYLFFDCMCLLGFRKASAEGSVGAL